MTKGLPATIRGKAFLISAVALTEAAFTACVPSNGRMCAEFRRNNVANLPRGGIVEAWPRKMKKRSQKPG
jgi:hypothetical protein